VEFDQFLNVGCRSPLTCGRRSADKNPMSSRALLLYFPLLALLLWAAIGDLRARRIPNALTFSIIATGLIQSFFSTHTVGPAASMLGLLVGFTLPFLLFALGALGGGDVKLLAGVGAWLGPQRALAVFLVAAVVGMLIVLIQASWQRKLGCLFRNSATVAINLVHIGELGMENARTTGLSCKSVEKPLPYALPVMAAVWLVLCAHTGGF
jgi:prepilin peptidase CpaA